MDTEKIRTWAEIDLGILVDNYRQLRSTLPKGCRFLGVVKADGYGHGSMEVAKTLKSVGAEFLAVACLNEGIALREGGITGPILVLGTTPTSLAQGLLDYDLTPSIANYDSGVALAQLAHSQGKVCAVHLKVDTGMSRLGWVCHEGHIEQVAQELVALSHMEGLFVEGLFTHFANADDDEHYTNVQFSRFQALIQELANRGVTPEICHCANSGAVVYYPKTHMDMVRPGIALYGYEPNPTVVPSQGGKLSPVMAVKSTIYAIKQLPAHTPISYGCSQELGYDARIAVVPIGYGDGLPRLASGKICFSIKGQQVPVVGRICMDMCMVDVTHAKQVALGDEVVIYGQGAPLEEVAAAVQTISYELLCQITPRVPRIYIPSAEVAP